MGGNEVRVAGAGMQASRATAVCVEETLVADTARGRAWRSVGWSGSTPS